MFCGEDNKPQQARRREINRPHQRQPIPIMEAREETTALSPLPIGQQPNFGSLPPPSLKGRPASSTDILSNSPTVRSPLMSPPTHALSSASFQVSTSSGESVRSKVDVEENVASSDALPDLRGQEEHVQSPALAVGRMRSANGHLSDHSDIHTKIHQRNDQAANSIIGRRGHDRDTERVLQEGSEEEDAACDPYDGGDEWCAASISDAQAQALEIQGTSMYCSRECAVRGGRHKPLIPVRQ